MMLHKLRSAMVKQGRTKLNGIVEIDETYVGGERHGLLLVGPWGLRQDPRGRRCRPQREIRKPGTPTGDP